jgi:uncharacterized protein YcfJ
MKSGYLLVPIALAVSTALLASAASAQPYGPRGDGVSFGYATVLRATPAYETVRVVDQQQQQCDDGTYVREHKDTTGATVLGAVVGGALGNTVGKGDGRKAATIGGAVVGGVIGHNIAKGDSDRYQPGPCHVVDVDHEDRRVVGYDVEYNYKGEVYFARMAYDPGNRIRVRVTVQPADDGYGPPPPPPPPHRH